MSDPAPTESSLPRPTELLVETPVGPARVSTHLPSSPPVGTLVLGHGAGGLGWPPDVVATGAAAVDAGWVVVLVDQPWRLAGRRVASPPATLDRAWVPVLTALRDAGMPRPLVVGGRSAGARVACRTAVDVGADAVLALSFPLYPPAAPERSRGGELREPGAHGIPTLVVQGERDPFGDPDTVRAEAGGAEVIGVAGTHSLTPAQARHVARAVVAWLATRSSGE